MTRRTTPGPWKVEDAGGGGPIGDSGGIRKVWQVKAKHSEDGSFRAIATMSDHPACEANARLIAAAPDMAEALEKVRRWLGGMSFTPACAAEAEQLIADCTAALAKARGAS